MAGAELRRCRRASVADPLARQPGLQPRVDAAVPIGLARDRPECDGSAAAGC